MSRKYPNISTEQKTINLHLGEFSQMFEIYKKCKECGMFSKPTRSKVLNFQDLHCRNCGEEL